MKPKPEVILEDFECSGCGTTIRRDFRTPPEGWYRVPYNVSVYLCPGCKKKEQEEAD